VPDYVLSAEVSALITQSLITFTDDFKINDLIRGAFAAHGAAPRVAGRSGHLDLVVAMVSSGMGVSALPQAVWQKILAPSLVAVPLVEPELTLELALVKRAGGYLSRSCLAWIAVASEIFGSEPTLAFAPRSARQD
jgi:DNA-binding transcriptional LysR family regulator